MQVTRFWAFSLMMSVLAMPSHAADFSDPTWPCIQRKVESLSLGLMWPHPVEQVLSDQDDALQREVLELAGRLALRRVPLDDMQGPVNAFAEAHDGQSAILGMVFDQVFQALSKRRARIIGGIGKFSLSQIALAKQIDAKRLEMDALLTTSDPDYDKVDSLEEQIDWDQVIHSDRQRSITYLCETPQLIEKRLFAIARMLQQATRD